MSLNGLPPAEFVRTSQALQRIIKELANEPLIAVDTESNSLHSYYHRVCLIQLSTRQRDYILDPLHIEDMRPLGALLANPQIEKVFHAAEYDLISMRREYQFEVQNLFDTMYAARLVGATQVGLADVLMQHFQVALDKRHQRDNWMVRPLDVASLRYAQMDTHFLPGLRDKLHAELAVLGRLDEAREVFADVLRIEARDAEFDPDGYWKIGRPSLLTRRQMALLRELYLLRDEIARREDKPFFRIFSNQVLVDLARQSPDSPRALSGIHGLSEWQVRVYGEALLAALERGRASRLPQPPQVAAPDPVISERYTALHSWRKERAAQRSLDASLILSKQTLWSIAEQMPLTLEALAQIPGMGTWRLNAYGAELLALVAKLKKRFP